VCLLMMQHLRLNQRLYLVLLRCTLGHELASVGLQPWLQLICDDLRGM